ncbi:class I SAM-dependent methyltransferase [Mycolicibacterium fluoranthenivorans]|uniref:Ubiquinone/menaquinone biosynthesis C-methylase UbiE n=1 Tax=Mycolicibacterium fluoranthenivorans TaxID=258505 RepID=A0A7X5U537_9MYCO|nr:class I SAM-dependent methyltransferase [Mycolicibacterium fluoranthenivorans]MCV7357557.1 class I SAM-dependent methyltransferase [Mycolicibacterium fluoranthenivorans]NIH98556.1 ubiquinone/menaquinone biosynthesis C-methylase UbiE [Mycolicibacterium fluoranthenivorans]
MTELICVDSRPAHSLWLRIMSVLYDPFLWAGEIVGMRRRRRTLLAQAYGRVLEIGAGTGLNVAHYPDALDELVLTEPEPGMRRKLVRRLDRNGRQAVISGASAERLPFAGESVDTVVATLVLCTVEQPERALREIARVLRPGGQLLFIEHIRSGWWPLALCQNVFARSWRSFAGGCVCNRPTVELMRAAGFTVDADDAVWSGMPAIVHPLAVGRATK